MDDYALVLNAGSSSLKFCVFRRPEGARWRLEGRGQIEGIGTSPHLKAKNAEGGTLADQKLDATVSDGRKALNALAEWLRSRYSGARIVAVGHRVVHGGPRYTGPVVITPEILAELHRLTPSGAAASAIQSGGHRSCGRAPPRSAPSCLLRHQLPSRPARSCRSAAAAARDLRDGYAAIWLPWPVVRVHRFCSTGRPRPRSRTDASSLPILEAARACALSSRKERGQHFGFHCAGWALHGNQAGRDRSRRDSSPLPELGAHSQGSGDDSLQEVRVCQAFQGSAMTCGTCWQARSRVPAWQWITSCIKPPNK